MGRVDVKSEEKAPLDTNKRGNGFSGRNNVQSKAFSGKSKTMNALQVKFDCGEGNKGGRFLECIWLTTAYLSTKLEGSGEVETSILELESI